MIGYWEIQIRGKGPNHNIDHPGDADRLAAEFVKKLRENNHIMSEATFEVIGQTDDLTPNQLPF